MIRIQFENVDDVVGSESQESQSLNGDDDHALAEEREQKRKDFYMKKRNQKVSDKDLMNV
jgi:hypothetical protein